MMTKRERERERESERETGEKGMDAPPMRTARACLHPMVDPMCAVHLQPAQELCANLKTCLPHWHTGNPLLTRQRAQQHRTTTTTGTPTTNAHQRQLVMRACACRAYRSGLRMRRPMSMVHGMRACGYWRCTHRSFSALLHRNTNGCHKHLLTSEDHAQAYTGVHRLSGWHFHWCSTATD